MLHRSIHSLALAAALAAILLGLFRNWDFWTVVRRLIGSYLVIYMSCGILAGLGRIALQHEPPPPKDSKGNDREAHGADGTDAAD